MKKTKPKQKVKIAEFEKGKVYALPIEYVSPEVAKQVAKTAQCSIVLMSINCFNNKLPTSKKNNK